MSVLKATTDCWRQAAEAEKQAALITDPHLKAVYLRIADQWSALARSYEFADSADTFSWTPSGSRKRIRDSTAENWSTCRRRSRVERRSTFRLDPGASVKKVIGAADCGEHRQAAEITTRLGDSWTMGFVYRVARERV